MRTIEQIRADWDLVEDDFADWGPIELAEERLYNDIPDVLAALAAKDAEIERLRRLSGRLEEAEYGMVAGNLANEPIPHECAKGWFYYVRTGKELKR